MDGRRLGSNWSLQKLRNPISPNFTTVNHNDNFQVISTWMTSSGCLCHPDVAAEALVSVLHPRGALSHDGPQQTPRKAAKCNAGHQGLPQHALAWGRGP